MEKEQNNREINEHGSVPATVYKYRDFGNEYHRNMILKSEFYFASPAELNDPYEMRCFPQISDETIKKNIDDLWKNPELAKDAKRHNITPDKLKNKIHIFKDGFIEGARKSPDKLFRIFSSSKHNDQIAQWAYYGNCHRGFCIEINTVSLIKCLNDYALKNSMFLLHSLVKHDTELPIINFDNDSYHDELMPLLFRKSPVWRPEEEYRFVLAFNHESKSEKGFPVYLPKLNEVITKVYFGCRYDNTCKFVKKVIRACDKHGIPIEYVHMHDKECKLLL